MAEGARLESVYTGNRIVGSNPTPSARPFPKAVLWPRSEPLRGADFGLLRAELLHPTCRRRAKLCSLRLLFSEACTSTQRYGFAELDGIAVSMTLNSANFETHSLDH